MTKIAISYRREDSKWITGRIFDRLEEKFGRGAVFMDIDNIPYGVDFRDHLQQALNACDVVLAIVGPSWLSGSDEAAQTRLFNPADWVRAEIAIALRRGIPIVPVLIDGTPMPRVGQLPDEIREFAYRQAAVIDTGVDFRSHMERLTRSMERLADRSNGIVISTLAVDTKPADTKPVDTKSVDTKSVDTKSVDTKPVDPKPVDTKPVDTKPVDTKSVDTKPVDIKPVNTKPVDVSAGPRARWLAIVAVLSIGGALFVLLGWLGSPNKEAGVRGPATAAYPSQKGAMELVGSWCLLDDFSGRRALEIKMEGQSVVASTSTSLGQVTLPVSVNAENVIIGSGDGRFSGRFRLDATFRLDGAITEMGNVRYASYRRC